LVERLREQTAIALSKGDNSLTVATARFMQAWLAHREIRALVPKVRKKYRKQMLPPHCDSSGRDISLDFGIIPINIKALVEEDSGSIEPSENALKAAFRLVESTERDEHEIMEEAAIDLIRLDRYERRIWSRYKRAIRSYMNLKLLDLNRVGSKGSPVAN
jgi:translation elongation factor EF-1beta